MSSNVMDCKGRQDQMRKTVGRLSLPICVFFFFSSRRRHTRCSRDWSSDVCSSDLGNLWAYDQVFTHLPQGLRNFAASGLGVAHEGYLQTLGELGPVGLFFQVAFIVVLIIAAARLFRRSRDVSKAEIRSDRILGLVGLGLICGSSAADFVASYFFLPPRPSLH